MHSANAAAHNYTRNTDGNNSDVTPTARRKAGNCSKDHHYLQEIVTRFFFPEKMG